MIFRAPAGHMILSKGELEKINHLVSEGNIQQAQKYINHCLEEISFYDDIRRMTEQKKMYKEDGMNDKAQSIERKIREKVRIQQETKRIVKQNFLF